jgi:cellulose synthase/poly-beta-1,6-N-acetylglucosamine synthase-like glycosyltransferase
MDSDFILQRDSLRKMGRVFQNDHSVVAACASVGVANACALKDGFMGNTGLPRAWAARFQIVEHLRGFRFARMFWSRLDAMLLTTGVFAVFRKETALAAGGFRSDALSENMEMVARLHRQLRQENKPYHIAYVPDPTCWTDVPESWAALKMQCIKRQIALSQSLEMNRQVFLGRRSGAVGWLGFPFLLLFEWLGPLLEVLGYVVMALLWLFGMISFQAFWTFLLAVIGMGMLLSTSALLMDEMAFLSERKFAHTLKLFAAAILENCGYRQLTSFWRVIGVWHHRRDASCKQ